MVKQGDLLTTDGIAMPLLVISKNTYNESGMMIVCPVVKKKPSNLLIEAIDTPMLKGYVICDSLRQLNWKERGVFKKGSISTAKLIMILDKVYAILDYV